MAINNISFVAENTNLVSVIIPVYNVKLYVSNTIDTILKQTYVNLELILVDDGSTDGSAEICDRYFETDGRVRVVHKSNSGASDSRNLGIDMARGDCVVFVDADDYIAYDMIEKMVPLMKDDVDMVSCGYTPVSEFVTSNCEKYFGTRDVKIFNTEEALADMMYQRSVTNTPWSKLFKKSLFEGVRFPSGKVNQDLGTIYKLIGGARKVALVDSKMYLYMYRPNSEINSRFAPTRIAGLEFAIEQREYARKKFPAVEGAAVDRLFMECVFIVRHMRISDILKYAIEYDKFCSSIKETRRMVLRDGEVVLQHKVSALASYFGIWTIVLSGYLIRLIQRSIRLRSKLISNSYT